MTFIINRFTDPTNPNFSENNITEEFNVIRRKFWNDGEDSMSLGNWLRARGAEVITSVTEEHAEAFPDNDDYFVLEIHFPSESAYLAFKLKHL